MSRLIDADVVWRKLQYRLKAYGNGHMCKKYKEMLDSIPTAYDVEKVVEGLEYIKEKPNGCFGIMCSECKYTRGCHTGEKDFRVAIDNAIDIVKSGGCNETIL